MLIILHGADTFRSRQKLRELQKTYLGKNNGFSTGGAMSASGARPASGWNYETHDAIDLDFKELKNILEAQSLFAQKRFIILKDLLENINLLNKIQDTRYEIQTGENTVVIYERRSVAKVAEYKSLIEQAAKSQEFKKLSQSEAVNYFAKLFPKFDRGIIKKVLLLCQQDGWRATKKVKNPGAKPDTMWQVFNELQKLYNYKNGKTIRDEDLQKLKIGQQEAQIFPTIDAMFGGNANLAFYNLLLHWQEGAAPEFVFYMIEQQLKNLALVKEARERGRANTKELGLHYYVIQKTSALADKFSWQKIKKLYERVESLDLKSKRGQIPPQLACELLSAAIVSS